MTDAELRRLLDLNPDLVIVGNERGETVRRVERAPVPKLTEHDLQCAVIAECDRRAILRPEYGLILHIPNGEYRTKATAGRLKAMGVRAGILDFLLPIARHGYHSLWIETKITPNKPTAAQLEWIRRLQMEGHRCRVIWDSFDEVMAELEWYIEAAV